MNPKDVTKGMSAKEKVDMANDLFSDLPDGAFFAAAEEHGVTLEDFEAVADADASKPKKET